MKRKASWNKKLEVEIIGPCTIRTGHTIKKSGVIYKRLDKEDGLTVREKAEFDRLYEKGPDSK